MAKKFNKKGEMVEVADETAAPVAEAAAIEDSAPELYSFEEWYAQRSDKIPAHHHKEILKADFKGRKVPELASMDEFDAALKKYGVKLD